MKKPILQELFHSLSNHLNTINNVSFITATLYLKKNLWQIDEAGKEELLKKLIEAFDTIEDTYLAAVKTLARIRVILSEDPDVMARAAPHLGKVSEIIEETSTINKGHIESLKNCQKSGNFRGFIIPILEEMTRTDQTIPEVSEHIDKAKNTLREMNKYPAPGQ